MKESKPWQSFILISWRLCRRVALLLILLILLVVYPNPVLKPLILYAVNERIPGEISIGYLQWSLSSIKMQDITYTPLPDKPSIVAKEIHGKFSFDADYNPQFTEVTTFGLQIPMVMDPEQGLIIEGIEPVQMGGESSNEPLDLPVLFMEDTGIQFQSEYGPVSVLVSGECSLKQNVLALRGQSIIQSPFLTIRGGVDVDGTLPNLNGRFSLDEFAVPKLFSLPIQGGGEFTTSQTELTLKGAFVNDELGVSFSTDTLHDIASKVSNTQVEFRIPNLKAALDASANKIPNVPQLRGGIFGKADVKYENDKMSGGAHITLDRLSVKDEDYNAENITGTIQLTDLETFRTPPGQRISIEKLESFLPLNRVKLSFQHLGGGRFFVQKAQAQFENGRLSTGSFQFESFDKGVDFTLSMSGVSAQYLTSLAKLKDISVTGSVDGELAMTVRDTDFAIGKGGKLWIRNPPGVIQYRPEMSQNLPHTISNLTGNENPMDLALIALWNLHYTDLNMTLDKPLGGELNATLHLKGKNPEAFSGHPFEFNISVSGEMLKVIRETLASIE